jgi:hypothetical protein
MPEKYPVHMTSLGIMTVSRSYMIGAQVRYDVCLYHSVTQNTMI